MPDIIGSVNNAATGAAVRQAAAAPDGKKPETAMDVSKPQIQPISPTIKHDPIAGVMVTQYLNGSGEVQAQVPSAAAVAYLRVGLTETGERPKSENTV